MRSITDLDGETKVVGVIGWPVRHSLSPPMQNAALAEMGLNWVYVPFEVSPTRIEAAVEGMRALGLRGWNVTVPHKESMARLVDKLGDSAGALGAVNTVDVVNGVLYGHNTDGEGFLRALREQGETMRGKRVAVIGAGGSARSVAYAVAGDGASEVRLVSRRPERAQEVAALLPERAGLAVAVTALDTPAAREAVQDADIVIDATPVGMHPHSDVPPVIPEDWLHEGQCVCDLVYTPRETTLLRAAGRRNARTLDGTGMLVHQGAIALERWVDTAVPVETMRRALLAALQARES